MARTPSMSLVVASPNSLMVMPHALSWATVGKRRSDRGGIRGGLGFLVLGARQTLIGSRYHRPAAASRSPIRRTANGHQNHS